VTPSRCTARSAGPRRRRRRSRAASTPGRPGRCGSSGFAAAGAGAVVGGGLVVGITKAIQSANEHAKAAAQTNAVIKSTGGTANVTTAQIMGLSNAIEKKSGMDDLAVQTGENMLLTFTNIRNEVGKGNDVFNQATKIRSRT
jgi:hypothetical protein